MFRSKEKKGKKTRAHFYFTLPTNFPSLHLNHFCSYPTNYPPSPKTRIPPRCNWDNTYRIPTRLVTRTNKRWRYSHPQKYSCIVLQRDSRNTQIFISTVYTNIRILFLPIFIKRYIYDKNLSSNLKFFSLEIIFFLQRIKIKLFSFSFIPIYRVTIKIVIIELVQYCTNFSSVLFQKINVYEE